MAAGRSSIRLSQRTFVCKRKPFDIILPEYIRVIIEDIPEDDIPAYITETKLNRDDLKSGQKAALAMRFHYNEERENGKRNQGNRTDLTSSPIGEKVDTHDRIAKMAGVGKGSIGRLLPVYRNRPDLFELVFNGEYSINRAYTQMKAAEILQLCYKYKKRLNLRPSVRYNKEMYV